MYIIYVVFGVYFVGLWVSRNPKFRQEHVIRHTTTIITNIHATLTGSTGAHRTSVLCFRILFPETGVSFAPYVRQAGQVCGVTV